MANTTIQIKRSSANAVPTTLGAAELAYSFNSDKLFIGNATGQLVVAIGGKYFVDQQNVIFNTANSAYDTANNLSVSSNAWTNSVFGWMNTYTNLVGAASNNWANTVGTSANAYATSIGASSNNWANTIATAVGAASNGWANGVGTSANAYAASAAVAANNYADSTFLKLSGGTINGSLNVSGNLILSGNTTFINVSTFKVDDSLIYLASNNYVSDVVDIGFVANYSNGACTTIHTGLFRDSGSPNKEWYLFQDYDKEPEDNNIDPNGNNFTIAVLNATLRTSNVILNGANLWSWVNSAYTQANIAPDIANTYAVTVGAASNNWANTVGVSVGAISNGWANTISTTMSAASNGWANSVGVAANSYAASVGAAANTNAANASYLSTGTVPGTVVIGSYPGITGVGTIVGGTWQANTITVPYGGTGAGSFTVNGVLFGNGTSAVQSTGAGTDGQVLVSSAGIPTFAHLDGGSF